MINDPPSTQVCNSLLLENLRIALLQSSNASAFLQLLIALQHIAIHDGTYCSKDTLLSQPMYSQSNMPQEEIPSEIQVMLDSASSPVFTRVISFLCGKIICQKEMTSALLISVLYSKPFE